MLFVLIMTDDLLPLLPSLVAMVEEAGVSRAAKRLRISQPRMSARLARLRTIIGDPLLVQAINGRGLIATDRATTLADAARGMLEDLASAISEEAFDPRHEARTFSIMANDNAAVIAGLPLVKAVGLAAGKCVRVALHQFDPARLTDLENGKIDLALGAPAQFEHMPALITRTIVRDGFVSAMRTGCRPVVDLDDYCRHDHVLVSGEGGGFRGLIDRALADLDRERHVALSVQGYLLALEAVATSDMIATLPRALVKGRERGLVLFDPPLALPAFTLSAAWHARVDHSASHRWLRSHLPATTGTG